MVDHMPHDQEVVGLLPTRCWAFCVNDLIELLLSFLFPIIYHYYHQCLCATKQQIKSKKRPGMAQYNYKTSPVNDFLVS